jgi:hypothetical protein
MSLGIKTFVVMPLRSLGLQLLGIVVGTFTVSHVFSPMTIIVVAVFVSNLSHSMEFTVQEFANVNWTIWPLHCALTFHIVINEGAIVDFTWLGKEVFTLTMELAVDKVSLVIVLIKAESSFTSFLALYEFTFVNDFVEVPLLNTSSVVLIIEPFSFVHASLLIKEDSLTAGFTFLPFTLINITIWMSHSTLAMEQTLLGLSLVLGMIWINYGAKTLPARFVLGYLPLTLIEPVALNVNLFGVPVLSIAWLQEEGNIILI